MPDLSQRVREINSAKATTRKVTAEKAPTTRSRTAKKTTAPKTRQAKTKTVETIAPIPVKVTAKQAAEIQKSIDKCNCDCDNWGKTERILGLIFRIEWMVIGVLVLVLTLKLIFGN